MRNNIVGMGLEPERLYRAMKRFKELGERGEYTWRVPTYQVLQAHAGWSSTQTTPTTCSPIRWCGCRTVSRGRCCRPIPSWFKEAHLRAGGLTCARTHTPTTTLDHRRRLHRPRHRDQAARGRRRRRRHPRARRSRRRNLARHHVSGRRCDIPSLLYSYSFVKNPTWSRAYSPAGEICRHIEDMADRFDLRRRIRFGHEVTGLAFDEDAGVWTATTANRKRFRARTVVLASGPLSDASLPDIRGLDTYEGTRSTAPGGTTTTTSPASGSPSSAPAPAPSRSSPSW